MWKLIDYCSGKEIVWYSEEEYLKLKNENEQLKTILEANKIILEFPTEVTGLNKTEA